MQNHLLDCRLRTIRRCLGERVHGRSSVSRLRVQQRRREHEGLSEDEQVERNVHLGAVRQEPRNDDSCSGTELSSSLRSVGAVHVVRMSSSEDWSAPLGPTIARISPVQTRCVHKPQPGTTAPSRSQSQAECSPGRILFPSTEM
jgi:hypothetical protein